MRILAVATNPETGASTRFRVLQWAPVLEREGFSLAVEPFYSPRASAVLYRRGRPLGKLSHFIRGAIRRRAVLARASTEAEILLIHREAFPLGLRWSLGAVKRFGGPLLYDYDDAMFVPQRQGRGVLARLEHLDTPKELMALSDVVLAGNEFLAAYARRYARRVVLLPTCIDTARFRPGPASEPDGRPLTIGWIGSHSTTKYLESVKPVLERLGAGLPFRVSIVGSAVPLRLRGVEVSQTAWALEREAEDFARCDIGVYPLWDDPWSQGKCGFKAIQFMACGVPVVASAVGANREIIQDGVNGFLAATRQEWLEKLGRLLTDAALRARLGEAGRRTIEERYSLAAQAPRLVGALREALTNHRSTETVPQKHREEQ
ncbi:MAG: glycosyltransferase family 4 protein [Candidatus Omnitrophica bacterium]|nr:glycosyltransferase family 4 protein [Candidatus Omnitrophota bacterium]